MDNKKVGCFIASQRKEKSMTQQSLADKLNVTSKAVSKWETGQGYPEITTIPTLAEILEVTTGELLNGEFSTKENSDKVGMNTIDNFLKRRSGNNISVFIIVLTSVFLSFILFAIGYIKSKKY
ncbi:helix-turn-helix domain-containing protein [Clostridium akagii]|uniref:helix-turn-helix domain-containing protein n=1 Tax=Clostridium akagii TaxID=91623 RepID=UPI00068AF0AB|nr:helix-turn-helix transcriptional regulator [Clostridium akagii]